jgi:chorismate synthase
MLRFLTGGESHGQALVAILDGMPAGLPIDQDSLNRELKRRQGGYGRGRRMAIEADQAEILSGVRRGRTLGTPITLLVRNRDWVNWQHTMSVEAEPGDVPGARRAPVTRPRPGHADLAGAFKYGHRDLRNILERASARETAARVAAGACARQLLSHVGITVASHVTAIGGAALAPGTVVEFDAVAALDIDHPVRCVDAGVAARMVETIDAAKAAGDTLGGRFEVIVRGAPAGLGTYAQWDRRLDARLATALMSIPAIKAVEIGDGVGAAARPGSQVHDAILQAAADCPAATWQPTRPTNHAGGLEGGMTNGEEIRVSAYMKPIATLMSPLPSVDLTTGKDAPAAIERSDACAVPAAAVVGEAMVAFVVAEALLDKFGGDSIEEIERNLASWRAHRHVPFEGDGA